jgi:hypothetical protein
MKPRIALIVLALATPAFAEVAALASRADFAQGRRIEVAPAKPVQEFTVPDNVYRDVQRDDLADIRVFNAAGVAVPHALCTGSTVAEPVYGLQELRVFPLHNPPQAYRDSSRIDVRSAGGAQVTIQEPAAMTMEPGADVWVVDSNLQAPSRALLLAWSTTDGASEAHVRVESSDDLDHWRIVVGQATLFHATSGGETLDRSRIELPAQYYRFLRLARDTGPEIQIDKVSAETVTAGAPALPVWVSATPGGGDAAEGFLFDAGRRAPLQTARANLPAPNMALRIALDSRANAQSPWQARWSGDVTSLKDVQAGTAEFPVTRDTLWRMRILRGSESLGGARPALQFGYFPARLRFIAQGEPPFVLAYGSARASSAEARGCDDLLGGGSATDLLGTASVAAAPEPAFGGPAALTPAPPKPEPSPFRKYLLWAVLLLGAGAVIAMALRLMKQVR